MSSPKYEFERYYAEEGTDIDGGKAWRVMGEDKPGNAQITGHIYTNPATGKQLATEQADAYNRKYATGFDAATMCFTDPKKQARWKREQVDEWLREKYDKTSTKTTILKGRLSNLANTTDEPGHAEANNSQAIEKQYPDWATFGSSSNNTTDQPEQNNFTLNIDSGGIMPVLKIKDISKW